MQQQKNSTSILKFCVFLAMLLCSVAYGQTNENIKLLRQKIQSADSVLLISHELTRDYAKAPEKAIGDTSTSTEPPVGEFLLTGY